MVTSRSKRRIAAAVLALAVTGMGNAAFAVGRTPRAANVNRGNLSQVSNNRMRDLDVSQFRRDIAVGQQAPTAGPREITPPVGLDQIGTSRASRSTLATVRGAGGALLPNAVGNQTTSTNAGPVQVPGVPGVPPVAPVLTFRSRR